MKGISVLFGDQYHAVPSQLDVFYVIQRAKRGDRMTRGKQTVFDLLMAGF